MTVGEVEHARELQALLFVDVHAEEELPLQLPDLVLGVGAALFSGALATCRGRRKRQGVSQVWGLQPTPEPPEEEKGWPQGLEALPKPLQGLPRPLPSGFSCGLGTGCRRRLSPR